MSVLLSVQNLRVSFPTPTGRVEVVNGLSFDLAKREFPNMIFNGTGQRPGILDLTYGTDGESDRTED